MKNLLLSLILFTCLAHAADEGYAKKAHNKKEAETTLRKETEKLTPQQIAARLRGYAKVINITVDPKGKNEHNSLKLFSALTQQEQDHMTAIFGDATPNTLCVHATRTAMLAEVDEVEPNLTVEVYIPWKKYRNKSRKYIGLSNGFTVYINDLDRRCGSGVDWNNMQEYINVFGYVDDEYTDTEDTLPGAE